MEKEKYNFVTVENDNGIIYITAYSGSKYSYGVSLSTICNATITYNDDDSITIEGDKMELDWSVDRIYVDELTVRPCENDIQKTLFRKREFVQGLYRTNTYNKYLFRTNNYCIDYK